VLVKDVRELDGGIVEFVRFVAVDVGDSDRIEEREEVGLELGCDFELWGHRPMLWRRF